MMIAFNHEYKYTGKMKHRLVAESQEDETWRFSLVPVHFIT